MRYFVFSFLFFFWVSLERAKKKKDQKAMQHDNDDNWFGICTSPSSWFSFAEESNEADQVEEMKLKQETKASRKYWRQIRAERFSFLDSNPDESEIP
jgi:predicted ATP-dependent serine protease